MEFRRVLFRSFVRRRLADLALVVVWVLALFQLVQIRGAGEETTSEIVITVAVALGLGLATTWLWSRTRKR